MRAGPAFLQFDWLKASLSEDLPVFVYFRIFPYEDWLQVLSRQGRYREQALTVLQDLGLNVILYEKQTRLINSKY